MTQEQRDLLFQAFTQGDTSTTRKFGGTGLGLCISQRLVDLMQGQITVTSEFGKGSEFIFTTRMLVSPDQTREPLILPESMKGLTVLVVDDCPESRDILAYIISNFDFSVLAADSGMAAMSMLKDSQKQRKKIDLVLIDMKMKGMTGWETALEIRNDLFLTMPIILMTSAISDIALPSAAQTVVDGFILKPITASMLLNTMMDVFGQRPVLKDKARSNAIVRRDRYKTLLEGLKILVVEDNRVNQEIACEILKSVGIDAHIAADGLEALDRLPKESFDAVLMDIQMPNMDGYEATRKIREMPQFKSLPIIAMTASVLMSDERHCLEAGMNGFVPKPIRQEKLFEALVLHLHLEANPPEPESAAPEDKTKDKITDIQQLPGLNFREAMENLEMDEDSYKKILSLFADTNHHTAEKIRSAARNCDWETLNALAHNLKGGCGNIGGIEVKETAEKIEGFCRKAASGQVDAAAINGLLTEMDTGLKRLLSSIDVMVPARKPVPLVGNLQDMTEITPVLSDLLDALTKSDPLKISTYCDKLNQIAEPSFMMVIENKIREYEYEDARETILQTAEQWGINLNANPDLNLIREKNLDE
jgi:CheY-like chemotaxis protein